METNLQIIPSFEASKAEVALREVETLKAALIPLEEEAKRIVVTNAEQYAEAGALLKRVRDNRKQGEETVKPLARVIQSIKDWVQTVKLQHQNQCERIETILEVKMTDQKRREREAAAAEEKRLNEERRKEAERIAEEQRKAREKEIEAQRKAGEIGKREAAKQVKEAAQEAEAIKNTVQEVKVEPAIPKVAGLRQRVNWKFKIVDANKIPRAFMMPNEVSIGQFVRTAKDKALAEKTIPGIECWSEDAI